MSEAKSQIAFDDFAKLDLRVATVLECTPHPNADKLLVLKVDLGSEQRQLVAALRGHYDPEQLIGRQIVVVANLAPRLMRGTESQGMLLAASETGNGEGRRVVVLAPAEPIGPGSPCS